MAQVNLTGLSTGIDTNALVKQLVMSSSGPLNMLKAQKSQAQAKANSFKALKTELEGLQDAAKDLSDANALRAFKVRSGDDGILTADVSSAAAQGSHTIVIDRLATAERSVHAGLASKDTLVGDGVLSYTYDGVTRSIQTTAETTLEGLVELINKDAGNPGVTASVLEYDAGASQVFHLVLSGTESGSDYAITINDAQTTLNGSNGTVDLRTATFTETQQAQDSRIRVDGYPPSGWIERSGNTVDDVLPGVTLDLNSAGTTTVAISRDTTDLKTKVKELVKQYNELVAKVQDETKYDAETKTAGILMGEYVVNYVRQTLRLPLVESASGFATGLDPYTLPGELGLSLDSKGMLELDEEKLDDAISDNYPAVLNLLGADYSGASTSSVVKFYAATSDTTAAQYDVEANFDGSGALVSARIKLTTEGASAWRNATVEDNLIVGSEDGPEKRLQLTVAYEGNAQETAQVRVRQGFTGRLNDLIDDLLDSQEGSLTLSQNRLTTSMDNIDKKIEAQNVRLEKMEETLRLKYAKLEQTLTLLQNQTAGLTMI